MTDITPSAPLGADLDLRARLRLIQVRTPVHHGFALVALSGTTHRLHCLVAENGEIRGVAGAPVDNLPCPAHLEEEAVSRSSLPAGAAGSRRVVANPLGWFSDLGSPLARIVGSALPDGLPVEATAAILRSYESLIGGEIEHLGRRLSPSALASARAMSGAVEFNWRAFALVSQDGRVGDAMRTFARANPALAGVVPIADGVMLGDEAHGKGPVTQAVLAGEDPSAIAGLMSGKGKGLALAANRPRFEPAAFGRLEGLPLCGTNAEKMDVIACAGFMHPSWVPRDLASMRSLMDVLMCFRAGLGKRVHPTTRERADTLFAGAKGDWASVIAKAVAAAGLPPESGAEALATKLGAWRRARAGFVDDVLIPATLLHGCPAIRDIGDLDPVYRDERLDTLSEGMLTRGLPLPALAAQAYRHGNAADGILSARARFPLPRRAAASDDGISHRLRYDFQAAGALDALLGAWQQVLPRSLRRLSPSEILSRESALWEAELSGRRAALRDRVGLARAA